MYLSKIRTKVGLSEAFIYALHTNPIKTDAENWTIIQDALAIVSIANITNKQAETMFQARFTQRTCYHVALRHIVFSKNLADTNQENPPLKELTFEQVREMIEAFISPTKLVWYTSVSDACYVEWLDDKLKIYFKTGKVDAVVNGHGLTTNLTSKLFELIISKASTNNEKHPQD